MIWGEAIRARVVSLWTTHTATQIVAELGKDGIAITRNSIIGIVHRAGKTAADKEVVHPLTTHRNKPRRPKKHRPVTKITRAGPNCFKVFQGASTDMPECAPIDVEPLNITIDQLTDDNCHAVTQDGPDWRYCGRPGFKRSNCWHHFNRYYTLPEKRFGAPEEVMLEAAE